MKIKLSTLVSWGKIRDYEAKRLEKLGFTKTDVLEQSDIVVLNTCAIRENAHNKVIGMLGRIKHLKESREDFITVFCGCMAQEETIANLLKDKYKWVDIVLGTHNIYDIPGLLENVIKNRKQNIEVYSVEGSIIENLPVKRDSKIKAWVNIQYGCDKFCSYCIVPYTRGKQRSRLPQDILKEIKDLKEKGYKEVTLLGQNVNAYGKDLEINYTMANLLEEVSETGIERIRFVTSHPWDFTSDMIDVIAKYPNIMPYIHLPIQSGSDNILKKMNRRYTISEYKKLFHELKDKVPGVSITTDIIVGFPGETEEDFQKTLEVYEELKYDLAYTFIYSPREGTPAAKYENLLTEKEKKERLLKLNKLINEGYLKGNKRFEGEIVEVLVEGFSEKNKNYLTGYTKHNKLVNFIGDESLIGTLVNVKIEKAYSWHLKGKIV